MFAEKKAHFSLYSEAVNLDNSQGITRNKEKMDVCFGCIRLSKRYAKVGRFTEPLFCYTGSRDPTAKIGGQYGWLHFLC